MSVKRMNKRLCRDGSFRLRFYHAHADQIETIELALERAREESGSEFDIVLLELICMAYLTSTPSVRPSYPSARTVAENRE
jgi:hypothetical protein